MASNVVDTTTAELVFRPMESTESDLTLFKECFDRNRSPRTLEHLRWQYFDPPPGRLFVDVAVTSGPNPSIAAIHAVFPSWMHAEGRKVLGVQSLDTLTDEAYRGKGLFVRMAKALYERYDREHVALVYGTPNGNSAHGFFKRLGWANLDPVPLLMRPLRTGYVLRKARIPEPVTRLFDVRLLSRRSRTAGDSVHEQRIAEIDGAFDDLWDRFATHVGFAVRRDAAYLRWRLRRPGRDYRLLTMSDGNRLTGWAAYAVTSRDGCADGAVMDLVVDPAREDAGAALLAECLHRMADAGCAVAWASNFEHAPNHRLFRKAGFFSPPARLKPPGLHIGALGLTVAASAISDRSQWYVSLLDADTD